MRFVSTQRKNWRKKMPAKVGAILELDTKEANQKVRQLQSEINKLGKSVTV